MNLLEQTENGMGGGKNPSIIIKNEIMKGYIQCYVVGLKIGSWLWRKVRHRSNTEA